MRSQCGSKLKLFETQWHRLVLVCYARLAPGPYAMVLADAAPSALLALALSPIVLADAPPSALLALALSPIVLADAPPSALPASAPYSIVLALPRLPHSCSLSSPAASPFVSVWRCPLAAALSSLIIRCLFAA